MGPRELKGTSFPRKPRGMVGLQDMGLGCCWGPYSWALTVSAAGRGAVKKISLCLGGAGLRDTEQMDFLCKESNFMLHETR